MIRRCVEKFGLIASSPEDLWLIAADWLENSGEDLFANVFRSNFNIVSEESLYTGDFVSCEYFCYGWGSSDGYGCGNNTGNGLGKLPIATYFGAIWEGSSSGCGRGIINSSGY